MNSAEIKETFYRRYGASDNFLHQCFTGAECTLLGDPRAETAPRLSCRLSMGITALARKLNGRIIKIQGSTSDRVLTYIPPASPRLFKGLEKELVTIFCDFCKTCDYGSEILYSSTIPGFIPQNAELGSVVKKALALIKGEDILRKNGYCTLTSGLMTKQIPLPLTGYKIISAYCKTKKKPEKADAFEAGLVYEAARGLEKLDIKSLFSAMNSAPIRQSDLSVMTNIARRTRGVAAAHENGLCAVIIAEENLVDYAVRAAGIDFENKMGYKARFCICDAI